MLKNCLRLFIVLWLPMFWVAYITRKIMNHFKVTLITSKKDVFDNFSEYYSSFFSKIWITFFTIYKDKLVDVKTIKTNILRQNT